MKSILTLALPLIASFTASANTMTFDCAELAILGQSNSGTENCAGFNGVFAPPAGATLNSIKVTTSFDFQFNPLEIGTRNVDYRFEFPNLVITGSVNDATRPQKDTQTITCAGNACAPYLASFQIHDSYTGSSAAITGATFSARLELDYTPQSDTPEPATVALIGVALIIAGILRR